MMRATTSSLRSTAYLQILESASKLKRNRCGARDYFKQNKTGNDSKVAVEPEIKEDCGPRRELGQPLVSLDSLVLPWSAEAEGVGVSFMPSFRARIPSPSPLPSSGNFLGPKTNRAMAKMMIRCVG